MPTVKVIREDGTLLATHTVETVEDVYMLVVEHYPPEFFFIAKQIDICVLPGGHPLYVLIPHSDFKTNTGNEPPFVYGFVSVR